MHCNQRCARFVAIRAGILCLTWRRAVGQPTALSVPRQKGLEEFTGDVPIRDRVLRLVAGEHRRFVSWTAKS
jgi:hypothetical protein